jgi:hypothetical protein
MSRITVGLALLCAVEIAGFAADDGWKKVMDLKTGVEVRVYKSPPKPPILAMFDEANEDRIVVVVKNEQVAIPKSDIERIDYRPKAGSRVTKENHTSVSDPKPARTPYDQGTGPTTSTSSSVAFGGKPDFETIYRRTATLPPAKK